MRQAFLITKEMRDRIKKFDELLNAIKEKVDNSTSYLLIIGEGIKKLVELIKERSDNWKDKKKKSKN